MLWTLLTRLGDSTLLLPLVSAGGLELAREARRWAVLRAWWTPLGVAIAIVLATKIAFLGFGIGVAAIDFTGASGHAMLAFAVYPVLAFMLTRHEIREWRYLALTSALALASAIAISRIVVNAHSASECYIGSLLGGVAAALSIRRLSHLPAAKLRGWWWVLLATGAIALVNVPSAPGVSHSLISHLALGISGRSHVYERAHLHSAPAWPSDHSLNGL